MQSSFFGKRQSKRELCFADSRRGQEASQLRPPPLAGWSILWTRACTIFPPPVLYGGPTTSTARSRLRSDRRLEAASAGRCWWSAALAPGLLRLPILLGAWPSQARRGRRSSLESLLLLGVDGAWSCRLTVTRRDQVVGVALSRKLSLALANATLSIVRPLAAGAEPQRRG